MFTLRDNCSQCFSALWFLWLRTWRTERGSLSSLNRLRSGLEELPDATVDHPPKCEGPVCFKLSWISFPGQAVRSRGGTPSTTSSWSREWAVEHMETFTRYSKVTGGDDERTSAQSVNQLLRMLSFSGQMEDSSSSPVLGLLGWIFRNIIVHKLFSVDAHSWLQAAHFSTWYFYYKVMMWFNFVLNMLRFPEKKVSSGLEQIF